MNQEPTTAFRVCSDGTGTHRTITEAIGAASPGDTIKIQTGVYEEVLIFEKPVTLLGDADGFVLIHHPKFTAIKVHQTEVIFENLALGACNTQISLAADSAKLSLKNCVVAATEQLRGLRASITTATSQSQAASGQPPVISSAERGTPNTISLVNGASVEFEGSVFTNVQINTSGSQMGVKNCTFVTSQIFVHDKAFLSVEQCRFICGTLSPAISAFAESKITLSHVQFLGIAGTAIQCSVAALAADDCEFHGTFSTDEYDDGPELLPPNTFWMQENNLPAELNSFAEVIGHELTKSNDSSNSLYGRFLGVIGATDGSETYPDYLWQPIEKKVIWAYRKKFNTQAYPIGGSGLLSKTEVLAPLGPERDAFFQFFAEADRGPVAYTRLGVVCRDSAWIMLKRTTFCKLKRGVDADCSGEVTAEDCLISKNDIGIDAGRSGFFGNGDGKSFFIRVHRTRFERNVTGFRIAAGASGIYKITGGDIRHCEIRDNNTGLDILGWSGTVRDCTFEKNATSITLSPFVLTSVQKCIGFGESTSFKVAQTIRRWLPF